MCIKFEVQKVWWWGDIALNAFDRVIESNFGASTFNEHSAQVHLPCEFCPAIMPVLDDELQPPMPVHFLVHWKKFRGPYGWLYIF